MKIIAFDLSGLIKEMAISNAILFDYKNPVESEDILLDNFEIQDQILDIDTVLLSTPLGLETQESELSKMRQMLTNTIDMCLSIKKSNLIFISNLTPYYGTKDAINEHSLRSTRNLDTFSLHLHLMKEEIARGKEEGLEIVHLCSGFIINEASNLDLILHNWWQVPINTKEQLLSNISKIISKTESSNQTLFSFQSIEPADSISQIRERKSKFIFKIKHIFETKFYENSIIEINKTKSNAYFST